MKTVLRLVLSAALFGVTLPARAQDATSVVVATQSCLGRKCETRLVKVTSAPGVFDEAIWRGPLQPYFTDVEEDIDGAWFVTDQGRVRTFTPGLQPSEIVGSKKEVAYSIVFDALGNAYVSAFISGGHPSGSTTRAVRKSPPSKRPIRCMRWTSPPISARCTTRPIPAALRWSAASTSVQDERWTTGVRWRRSR